MTEHFDVAVYQVRAGSTGAGSPTSQSAIHAPSVLEVDELTILTGWAQAVAEVLDNLPKYREQLNTLMTERFHLTPAVSTIIVGVGEATKSTIN